MSTQHPRNDECRRPEDSPAAWFVVLERARQTHDFELAATAQRELERLGVKVSFRPAAATRSQGVDRE